MKSKKEVEPIVEFRDVSLSFGEVQALRNVSFELNRGEMICITGASASGKTVLLHLAMGLIKPDQGEIIIEGCEIGQLNETELLAIRGGSMGIVFQEDALFSGLSVFDNTAFRMDDQGRNGEEIERSVGEILQFVGLGGERDRLPEELSGGMRRRLEFARALVGWPKIMLYDEPTEGLDPLNATQLLNLIISARDLHGVSSLLVTKNLEEIPYLATHRAMPDSFDSLGVREQDVSGVRVMLLDQGRIAFLGTAAEFSTSQLPAVTYLTRAENGTILSDFYTPDPWSRKNRRVKL
jgi:phospholipid/cholesterol/gamma-HCH transport system ATP-binding protein